MRPLIFTILSGILFVNHIHATPQQESQEPTTVLEERSTVILIQGEQRLLKIPYLQRFSIGNAAIVRAIPISNTILQNTQKKDYILIKAMQSGLTDLWVWKSDHRTEHRSIQVEKPSDSKSNLNLEKALSQLQEVEVLRIGVGILLRGTVYSHRELHLIQALIKNFSKEMHDETDLSSDLLETNKANLEGWLKNAGYQDKIQVEQKGGVLFIKGFIPNINEKLSAERNLKKIFPLVELELESLPDNSPTVFFRVFLLELKKKNFHTLGLSWPSHVPQAFQVTPWSIKDALKFDLTLQTLEGNGSVKILSRPELAVRVPGEAELFAGGELPIRIKTRYTSNITWKKYGLTLQLKVTHAAGKKVRLEILTEVSHIDPNLTNDELPKIQTNKMKTQVDAEFYEPLMLSGLLQQDTREQAQGIPWLRNLPILGSLFGSEDYLNERSELVAVLYPVTSPPRPPLKRFEKLFPLGPVPIPRNWISPSEERALKSDPDFPWNALQ
ncbi:MAG: pilus assembly protein N-terminal domain-containing protein [Bdellovibrio sp.]|nr:pilus assembly protein N-terminal domain-containing protein [Bdellovibrio sp.]